MLASRYSSDTSSLETVKLLLDNGASIVDKNNDNVTAIDLCPTEECRDIMNKDIK